MKEEQILTVCANDRQGSGLQEAGSGIEKMDARLNVVSVRSAT